MKQYPTIPYWNKGIFGESIYAFDKLDGSNFRVSWDRKLSKKSTTTCGFNKFGTKTQIINKVNENFGDGVDIFLDKYGDALDEIFREDKDLRNARTITVFCEYFGANSFAGWHDPKDIKDVVLFDVDVFQKGLMKPKDFVEKFGHLHIPNVVYQGNYNQSLIDDVRANKYNLTEGVVCKGSRKTKGQDLVWMAKIKCDSWLHKVRNTLGQKKLIEELNNDKDLLSII